MYRLGSVDVEGFVTNVNKLAERSPRKSTSCRPSASPARRPACSQMCARPISGCRRFSPIRPGTKRRATSPAPRTKSSGAARDAGAAAARLRKIAANRTTSRRRLIQFQQTLSRMDRMLAGRENDVAVTLNNLRQITDNLRDLSENAKRYPSGVIFGEPPKREGRWTLVLNSRLAL